MKYLEFKLPLNGDTDEWRFFDEEKPIDGELCTLKFLVDLKAYYLPSEDSVEWMPFDTKTILNIEPLAWRPEKGGKNYFSNKLKKNKKD